MCVFDGIIHKVDDDLHNEPGIHAGKQKIIRAFCCNAMFNALTADMTERFGNDLADQFGFHAQVHAAVFNAGDSQQIFYQIDQPHGIVVDVRVDLQPGGFIDGGMVGEQVAGIAGYGSQRGAQIMGDGTQQIGPEPFLFHQKRCLLLFPDILAVFHGQGALSQYGNQNAVFKGIHGMLSGFHAGNSIDSILYPDGQIMAQSIRESVGIGTGPFVVSQNPQGDLPFPGAGQKFGFFCGSRIRGEDGSS